MQHFKLKQRQQQKQHTTLSPLSSRSQHYYNNNSSSQSKLTKSGTYSSSSYSVIIIILLAIIVLSTPIANCDKLNSTTTTTPLEEPTKVHKAAQDYSYAAAAAPKRSPANSIKNSSDARYNNKQTSSHVPNNIAEQPQQQMSAYVPPPPALVYTPQQFYFNDNNNNNNGNWKWSDMDLDAVVMPKEDFVSFSLVTGLRENICKGHCECESKNKFIAIHCDFEKNPKLNQIFDADLLVPLEATSLTVKLAQRTRFELRRNFFKENRVNSITIDGTYSEKEQVELTNGALLGNNGGYPEIIFNNVFSMIIRKGAFGGGDVKFTVRNSNDVILYRDAFNRTNINGVFYGINDLRIEEKAFNSDNAKLHIESTHIDDIYRFEASLREIRFVNCTIGNINGGTFDVNTVNSIIFERCRINAIKSRAITDKLMSNHVSITDAVIGYIEKEAIYGSGITELIFSKNDIDRIHENAISVTAVSATIADNNIKHLGKHWLRIKEWSNISVQRNNFGEFDAMLLEDAKHPAKCIFDSNFINLPSPGSLNYTNCRLHRISVDKPCTCKIDWLEELTNHDLRSELYCTIDKKLSYCYDADNLNLLKYLNDICDETKTNFSCNRNYTLRRINGHFFTKEELEQKDQSVPLVLFVVVGTAVLATLLLIVLIVACRFCRSPSKHVSSARLNGEHVHEFSATERNVIRHALEVMQKRYPEIYKPINERSQLLMQPNLSDKKCVKTISQIVNFLGKAENSADDFMAFNRVLTQHLQPRQPTAPPAVDPIYTEPGMSGVGGGMTPGDDDGGFYTSSTIVGLPISSTLDYIGGQSIAQNNDGLPEHIYAEPSCAQQPLLRNEYASPADRNVVNENMELYTEPVGLERDSKAGYAPVTYQQHQRQQQQLPPYAVAIRPTPAPANASTSSSSILPKTPAQSYFLKPSPKYSFQMSTFNPSQKTNNNTTAAATSAGAIYTAPNLSHKSQQQQQPQPNTAQSSFDTSQAAWDLQGATALTPDSGSNHSGGTNETLPIDEVIEYVDA